MKKEMQMTDYSDSRFDEGRDSAGRFGRWLGRRPAESWMFLAAGLVLGGFFF